MTQDVAAEPRLSRRGRTFVAGVIVAGVAVVVHSGYVLASLPPGGWMVLALLTFVASARTIRVPGIPSRISVSEVFIFTSVVLYGPAPGTVTLAIDGFIFSLRRKYAGRALFNSAELAVSIWSAGQLLGLATGGADLRSVPTVELILPLAVMVTAYFVANSGLIAIAVAFEAGGSPVAVWRRHFVWLSIHYVAGASASLLFIIGLRQLSLPVIAAIVPLIVISYLTFWAVHGRIDDAQKHLADLDRLYQSTVETLATAIDAKDGVTHDHIRRVQAMAVALARELGMAEEKELKAVQAAALLHDTGKLAVPEHILNKPGRLTPSEFEQMKRHASIGADILSAVEFPYPVVPIVRHHHESWDGSGYPDGIRGDQIPLGARILSVVDCYDALTSDRPYRRALSETDALTIILERRGTMYDPAVVDAFVAFAGRMNRVATPAPRRAAVLADIARVASPPMVPSAAAMPDVSLDETTEEMLALCALAQSLSPQARLGDAGLLVCQSLKRLAPSVAAVTLYAVDPNADDLILRYGSGRLASLVGQRVRRGSRLSGWVAQHRQPIVNSDAALELEEVAQASEPRLRTCVAVPLTTGDRLMGVLSMYSCDEAGIPEAHTRLIQVAAPHLADALDPIFAADPAAADQGRAAARTALKLVSTGNR